MEGEGKACRAHLTFPFRARTIFGPLRHGYQPHIKQRQEEAQTKRTQPGYPARRWVVERTHSWLNRYRKLLVSFEKTEEGYVALLTLAAAMICWRQTIIIYG